MSLLYPIKYHFLKPGKPKSLTDGTGDTKMWNIHKPARNELCTCNSGLKFKNCCRRFFA